MAVGQELLRATGNGIISCDCLGREPLIFELRDISTGDERLFAGAAQNDNAHSQISFKYLHDCGHGRPHVR